MTDAKTSTAYTVFAFANNDGWVPPEYAGNTFAGSHNHYRTSGAATVTSGDLDEIVDDFKSHGYSAENGSQIVVFVSSTEGNVINSLRVATGARSDFIPSSGARFFANEGDLVGTQVAATYAGFPVKGSYEEALIIEDSRIPAGYVAAMSSGGSLVSSNPVMLRQHERYQGLQVIPGDNSKYPLKDSYWVRSMGSGVRHRLAGMVMQITASGSYTAPALYVPDPLLRVQNAGPAGVSVTSPPDWFPSHVVTEPEGDPMIMSAIEDAEALVPWIEQNTDALNWEPLDEAVQRALSGPVPAEYSEAPLLRFANIDIPARTLLDAVLDPPIPRGKAICDITGTLLHEPNTLWVPCGRSVVQVTMRNFSRALLSDHVGVDLVWC